MPALDLTRSPLALALSLALATPALAAPLDAQPQRPGPPAGSAPATAATAPALAIAASLDRIEVHGQSGAMPASPKLTEPLLDTPKSVTVVPAELLQEQGVTTLREALRNVPGISLQAGEGGVPAGDNLTLRGFSARTDLFIDGVRDFGGYTRDAFNIEQIEVVKGPASTHSGRGSTGGSINLDSKAPRSGYAFQHGTLSAGSADLLRATADFNQPFGEDAAFRLNLMAHESGLADRDAVESRRWGVAPSIGFGLGDAATATLSLFHLEQDNLPDYGHPWVPAANTALPGSSDARAPVDRANYYGLLARDYEDTRTDLATLVFDLALGGGMELRNLTRWGESRRDSIITAPRFLANDATLVRRTAKTRDSADEILTNVTDLVARLDAGGVQHTLLAGVELAREESSNLARSASDGDLADLFDPDFRAPYTGVVERDPLRDAEASADSAAVYLFDTVTLSPHWELSGGLRWDRFDVEAEGYDRDLGERARHAREDSVLSGRAAALFKPNAASSYYLAWGTSFNPSAEGLALNAQTAALEPEDSRTLELGGKWSLYDDRLLVSGAVFRTEKTNARTEDADEIEVLEGEQRVDGFEVSVAGRIGERWTLFGGYAFLDGEVVDSLDPSEVGNTLGNTPRHSASLWASVELTRRWQLGFGAQHVGARFSNTANTREAKAYTLFDAMASYRASDAVQLRVNAYNLSDKDYVDTVGGGHYGVGAGRSVMASVDLAF